MFGTATAGGNVIGAYLNNINNNYEIILIGNFFLTIVEHLWDNERLGQISVQITRVFKSSSSSEVEPMISRSGSL